ncbi:hypothetical protein QE152_g37213 [Popillia japonica]|uniref:Uncharacterized protein n=1 Tax=Popillia japonica TaxID=7064 RepID=A0AAW1IB85_POPJA
MERFNLPGNLPVRKGRHKMLGTSLEQGYWNSIFTRRLRVVEATRKGRHKMLGTSLEQGYRNSIFTRRLSIVEATNSAVYLIMSAQVLSKDTGTPSSPVVLGLLRLRIALFTS